MRASIRAVVLQLTGLVATCAVALAVPGADSVATSVRRVSTHPMRYHLALPSGWTADREWPVLVVVPDAARDFEANLRRFVRVRGERPYILIAPEVLSCGGARSRTPDRYAFTPAEWDSLRGGDDFAFEDAGLAAVLADARERWHGEPRAFLTGWEAGGHTVWAQALRHPERWRAVAPVTPNYLGRGVDSATVSRARDRATLPIQVFRCGAPTGDAARAVLFCDQQTALALRDSRERGFNSRAVRVVPGADHGPLPEPVFAWCDSLRRR